MNREHSQRTTWVSLDALFDSGTKDDDQTRMTATSGWARRYAWYLLGCLVVAAVFADGVAALSISEQMSSLTGILFTAIVHGK